MAVKKPKCSCCAATLIRRAPGVYMCPVGFIDFYIDESKTKKSVRISNNQFVEQEEYIVPPGFHP